jgi:hypothetical protein
MDGGAFGRAGRQSPERGQGAGVQRERAFGRQAEESGSRGLVRTAKPAGFARQPAQPLYCAIAQYWLVLADPKTFNYQAFSPSPGQNSGK